jgi:hypothetical protein
MAAPDPFERLFFAGHRTVILEKVYSAIAIGSPELPDQAIGFTAAMAKRSDFVTLHPFVRLAPGYAGLLLKLGVCCKSLI